MIPTFPIALHQEGELSPSSFHQPHGPAHLCRTGPQAVVHVRNSSLGGRTIPQVTSLEEGQRQKVCSLGLYVPPEGKRVKFFIKASLLGTPFTNSQALWP